MDNSVPDRDEIKTNLSRELSEKGQTTGLKETQGYLTIPSQDKMALFSTKSSQKAIHETFKSGSLLGAF